MPVAPGDNGVMASVEHEVDQVGTRLLVRLTGDLTVATAPRVRAVLAKCLVDAPDALVVDVGGLRVREPSAFSVFLAVARQAALWPGTTLLLCRAEGMPGTWGRVVIFATAAEALAAPVRHRLPVLSDRLLPVRGAARRGRELSASACERWGLPRLVVPAALVAGELVTNAVVHAGTMADLRISRARWHLLIAVRDGSRAEPRIGAGPADAPGAGRGLRMVAATARRWGSLPAPDGKVVWAALTL